MLIEYLVNLSIDKVFNETLLLVVLSVIQYDHQETSNASDVTGIFSIFEIKQLFSASLVIASNSSELQPGTFPVMERCTPVIPDPSIATTASVSNEAGMMPFSVSA